MVTEGDRNLTIKATPNLMWETSKEFDKLCLLIGKHRKHIL